MGRRYMKAFPMVITCRCGKGRGTIFTVISLVQGNLRRLSRWSWPRPILLSGYLWSQAFFLKPLILVCFIALMLINQKGHLQRQANQIFLASLAVLLTPGTSAQPMVFRNSLIFTLWMFITIIFVTYYGGSLTSEIISPTPEKRMIRMEELFENKYWLVLPDKPREQLLKKFLNAMLHHRSGEGTSSPKRINQSGNNLNLMFHERRDPKLNFSHFLDRLATGGHHATVNHWQGCIMEMNQVMEHIRRNGIKKRKCYVGQELAYHTQMYYIISPHRNKDSYRMARYLQTLIEMGFYQVGPRNSKVSRKLAGSKIGFEWGALQKLWEIPNPSGNWSWKGNFIMSS